MYVNYCAFKIYNSRGRPIERIATFKPTSIYYILYRSSLLIVIVLAIYLDLV